MKIPAVYLMLKLGGKDEPTKEEVTAALGEVGVEVDDAEIDRFFTGIANKDVDELVAYGLTKLSGGGGGGGGGSGGAGGNGEAAAADEEKEEEEEEEEIDMGGGMDMFGGDEGGGDDY